MASRRQSAPRLSRREDAISIADLGYPEFDRDDFHDAEITGVLASLADLQMEMVQQRRFKDAEVVRLKLTKLKEKDKVRREDESEQRALCVKLGIETAHMQELQEFNDVWDAKDAEFEMHVASLHEALKERHKENLAKHMEQIEAETEPRHAKWSKELLNQRKIEETLVKQKNYVEAAKIKEEVDKLERKEEAKYKALRRAKLSSLEDQFKQKQHLEMSGLMARINANRSEHKQARKKELERLLQRYHNVKTQHETQQKIKSQSKYKEVDSDSASLYSRPSLQPRRSVGNASRTSVKGGSGSVGRSTSAPGTGQQRRPGTSSSALTYDPPRRSSGGILTKGEGSSAKRSTTDWR
jgi:hypothetical protein